MPNLSKAEPREYLITYLSDVNLTFLSCCLIQKCYRRTERVSSQDSVDRRQGLQDTGLDWRSGGVALLGPRQVGKTTLAHSLADELGQQALYLDLELPSDRAKLTDAELYLSQHAEPLVILDEIHRLPGIFETLRSLIDQRRRKGSILA